MDGLALTTGISTLASAIAGCLTDEETALAAAVFTQLGDTLTTILAQRALCCKKCETCEKCEKEKDAQE